MTETYSMLQIDAGTTLCVLLLLANLSLTVTMIAAIAFFPSLANAGDPDGM